MSRSTAFHDRQQLVRSHTTHTLQRLKTCNDHIRETRSPCERDHFLRKQRVILAERAEWTNTFRLGTPLRERLRHVFSFFAFFLSNDGHNAEHAE